MSQWDKLLSKILALSNDIRFDELKKILEHYGYDMKNPGKGSSHYTFRKKGSYPITIPKHKPIKEIYIKMVREIVEREIRQNENN